MKKQVLQRINFFSKSLLWSLLLYTFTVLLMDWSDIKAQLQEKKQMHIVSSTEQDKTIPARIVSAITDDDAATSDISLNSYHHLIGNAGAVLRCLYIPDIN